MGRLVLARANVSMIANTGMTYFFVGGYGGGTALCTTVHPERGCPFLKMNPPEYFYPLALGSFCPDKQKTSSPSTCRFCVCNVVASGRSACRFGECFRRLSETLHLKENIATTHLRNG